MKTVIGRFGIQTQLGRVFANHPLFQALFPRLQPAPIPISRRDADARSGYRREVVSRRHLPLLMLPALLAGALVTANSSFATIGIPASVGQANSTTTSSTLAVTVPAAGVAAGNSVIISFAMDPVSGTVSVTDSRGNTYTDDADATDGNSGNGVRTVVLSAPVTTALVSGDTITITFPSVGSKAMSVYSVSDLISASRVDKTSTGTGDSTTPSSGTTATTTHANELLIGAIGSESRISSTTMTAGSSYTLLNNASADTGNSSTSITIFPEYRIVSATGAQSAAGALSSFNRWADAIVTYVSADQVITFPSPGNQTYGGSSVTLTATADSGLAVGYAVASGPATLTGNSLTITGAGSVSIVASQAGNSAYNAAPNVTNTITVNAKVLTVSGVTDNGKVYDGRTAATLNLGSATLNGVLAGDVGNVSVNPTGYTANFSSAGAGTKSVTVSGLGLTGLAAANYSLTQLSLANATISAAPLTITANNQSKNYGATMPTGTGQTNFTPSGLKNGETVGTVSLACTGAAASTAIGNYTITASGATGGTFSTANYSITYATGTLTVNPAPLSITANAQSKSYGSALALGTSAFTASGLQNSQTIGSVTLTANAGTAATDPAGVYTITPSAAIGGTFIASDYAITYNTNTLMVNPRALTITASAQTKTYGNTLTLGPGMTSFTSSGLQNGETIGTVTLTASGGTAATDPAGTYTITPSAATGGTFNTANYNITFANGTLTVLPGTLDHYGVSVAATHPAGLPFVVTVTAQDSGNNPLTNDSGTVLAMTATGNAQFDHNGDGIYGDNTATLTNGTFGILTRDLTEETVTLTATDTNGITGNTTVTISAPSGAYRSIASGAWSSVATWQTNNGSGWVAATAAPTSANATVVTIQSPNVVMATASVTVEHVIVQSGAQVTVSNGITMTIANGTGTDFDVLGTLENAGTVTTTGTLLFESGGTYEHDFTTTAGTVPTATWTTNSTCEIIGFTGNTSTPGGLSQNFGNFTWNCPSQTGTIVMETGDVTQTIYGDFTIVSTGTGTLDGVSSSDSLALTIEGDFNIQGGNFNFSPATGSQAGPFTLTLLGAYNQTGGTFTHTSTRADLSVNFSALGDTFTQSGGTLTTTAMNFSVPSGSSLTLNNNIAVSFGQTFTVSGSLYCGASAVTGSGAFTLSSAGNLGIGLASGLSSTAGTGNLQVTGSRSLSSSANYIFDGSAAQAGGNALPTTINNLIISNASGVVLNTSVTVNGTLGLSNGLLATGANTIIIPATGSIAGASASSYVDGNLQHAFNTGNSQSYTFPIGDAANYLPLNLSSMNVTHAGNLTVKTVGTEHPNIPTSLVDSNLDVTRYWTITNGSSLAATYSATFNYSANDVDAGANPALFIAQDYNGSAWANATLSGTPTTTSASISGQTVFGDFAFGQPKSSQTITFPAIGNQTYGVAPITLGATASSGLPVSYTVSGPANVSSGILTITGAANVTVTASQSGSADWLAATNVAQTITVSKLTVSGLITVNDKVYDGTTTATIATRSLNQVVGSDNVALSGGTAVFSSKNVGAGKTVVATGLSLINSSATNYTLASTSATNTASITARPITITGAATSKGYDGTTTSATVPTITSGTLATGDTSGFSESFVDQNVGTGKTVIPAGAVNDGNSGANYNVTFANANVGTITARAITVKAVTDTRVYDGTTASAVTPTISSGTLATGDTAGFSQTFNNRNVGAGKTLTPSGSVNDGNNGANYAVIFSTVNTGSITASPITVTAVTDTKVYDGTSASVEVPTVTTGILASGDTANFSQTFSTRNVGAALTLTPAGSVSDGNGGANYSVTIAPVGTGTITALPITVTGATASKTYDGTTSSTALPIVTGTLGSGDTANFNETYDTKDIGTGKTMTLAGSVSDGNSGGNYNVTFVPAAVGTISADSLTATATGINKVYDGTTAATVTLSVNGFGNDDLNVTGSASFADPNVGTNKPVTVTNLVLGGAASGDYTLAATAVSTVANITPALLTATADNYSRSAGTTNPVFTASYSGFVAGDDTNVLQGAPLLTSTADTNSLEGTYPITITNGTLSATNYTFAFVNGTLTVIPANLLFSDNFTRDTDPQPLLPPWAVESGNWSVTGGVLVAGANQPTSYADAYIDTNWSDYSIEAKIQFSSLSAFGGGIGGRLNAANGAHYAAWVYPANSTASGLAGSVALLKFQDWQDWGYLGTNSSPMQQVALPNMDTNWHTLRLAMRGNQIAVSVDGVQLINATDAEAQPYLTGGITADLWTDANPYVMSLDDVYVAQPAAQFINFAPLASATYGDAPLNLSATASSGLPVTLGILSGPAVITNNVLSITGAGTVTVAATQAGDATYAAATEVDQSFTVNPAPLGVNADNSTSVYGAAIPALTGELTGVVNGDNITASYSTVAIAGSPVGSYAITPGLNDPNLALTNYTVSQTNGTLTISPAPLSVSVDNLTSVYGGAIPTLTGELTGVVNGDSITAVYSTVATSASSVGGYAITPSLNDPNQAATNYTVTLTPGTLTVGPAALTLTANNATQVYGAAQPAFTGTVTGVVNNDGITANYTTAALPNSGVGSYNIVPSAVDPNSKLGNYTVSLINGTLSITPAGLTGTVASQSRPYGGTNAPFSVGYSGFVNNDDASVVSGAISFVCLDTNAVPVDTNSPVGSYPIHVTSGQTAANYTIGYVDGSLTVTPASLLVSAQNQSRAYGMTNPAPVAVYSGLVNNEDSTGFSGSPEMDESADTNSPVGTYPIVVSQGSLSNANYALSFSNATLTVTAEVLTVVADNLSQVYGAASPTLTGTVTGLNPADGITVSYSTTASVASGVGGYAITPSLTDPNLALSNYTVTLTPGTLTISPAPLSVSADNLTSVYGGAVPTLTGELTGVVNGDSITASYSTMATASSGVGAYAITPSLTDPNQASTNYTVTLTPGTLTISPAPLSVSTDNLTSVYGGAIPTLTGELTGVVNGDNITAVYTTAATGSSGAGAYAITSSLNDPNQAATNYTVTLTPGTLTISPAPLSISADSLTSVYGAVLPILTGQLTGVVNGDSITAVYSTTAASASSVGGYAITPSLNDPNQAAVNYTVTLTPGALSITPAGLTGTVASQSRPYGGTNAPFSVGYSGFVNNDDASVVSGAISFVCLDTNAVPVDTNSPVGSYPIHVTSGQTAANYTIGYVDGSLTVTPASLLVSAQNQSRAYGMTNPAPVAVYSGLMNNEDSTVFSGSSEMDVQADTNSPVGTYPIVVSQGTLSNANYALSFSNATLTVTAEALTVVADNLSQVYGAANPALTGTVTGLNPADGITVSYSTTATAASGVGGYAITPSLTDPNLALSNYTVTLTPGTLTISPAPLSVSADNLTSVYGGAVPTLTGELTGVVNGDSITASYSTVAIAGSPVGSYAITPTLNDPNQALTNYTVTSTPGSLTIGPAALSVSADNLTSVYGGMIPTLTGELIGVVNGDSITASYSTTAASGSPAGGYAITPSLNDPNQAATNYTVTLTPGTLTVGPAALTLTANNATQVYGAAQPAFTGTVTGVVNNDGITANYATTALPNSGVGSYDIVPSPVDPNSKLGNYAVSLINGTLSITPAPSSITWTNPADIVYGEALGDAQLNASGSVPGVLTYDPPAGTVLNVSNAQVLSVTLAPADTNYTPSSASVLINVLQAGSIAVVTSSTNPALPGTSVMFTASLNAVAPGAGTPTGAVQFSIDGSPVGSPVALAGGAATMTTSTLGHGAHSVSVTYGGDTNFTGSTNAMAAQQIINTPPTAPSYTVTTTENTSYTFPAAQLLQLASDADGDPLSLTAVTATDTNGGTVSIAGDMITYTAAFGITNAETFTYTVADPFGGTATGLVTVNIVIPPPSNGPTPPITIMPNGHAALALTAQPGEQYMLQGSADLQNWVDLGEVTAGPDGMVRVEDADAPSFSSRYYRLVYSDND